MSPIDVLMNEHRAIERAIDALTAYARAVDGGADHPRADLAGFVAFIQDFADAHHHGKEEEILFRAMADHGMPLDAGPLGVMLSEHREGRLHAQSLAELAEAEGDWDPQQRKQLLMSAFDYAQLLREHIQKEDEILYPMASHVVPADAWTRIESEFAAFEAAAGNAARASRMLDVARDLGDRYRR